MYRITPAGETRFLELMGDPAVSFNLKMLFFQSISPSDRRQLLEQRRGEWIHELEARQRDQERIAERSVDRYRAALLARAIEHLERDVAWIQNLIEEEEHK